MRFQIDIKSVALMFGVASSIKVPVLPAGAWSIEESSDGSFISRSVDDPALGTIITQNPLKVAYDLEATFTTVDAPSEGLLWANGDCWSTRSQKFNTAGTDRPVIHIKEWYSVGRPDLCLNDSNHDVRVYSAGGPYKAMAYFCIAAKNTCEHVNPYDINDALKQIDARCPLHQAILSRWPGSNELVPKVNLGDHICVY